MSNPNFVPGGPFRIAAVARMTGVPAPTLRAWERRYGIPEPARTASAYRTYSAGDVELVRAMRALCAKGVAAADAARAVRASPPTGAASQPPSPIDVHEASIDRMLAAIEAYDAAAIDKEIVRASMLGNAQTFYERLISPLLRRVGDRWHDGTLSVAQEHFASERLESQLRRHLALVQPEGATQSVLLGCFADEDHVFGLLGAATAFASRGYRVELLGARTPPFAVRDAVGMLHPTVLGLSVTMAPSPARARELAPAYAEAAAGTPWVVGGPGVEAIADVIERHGGHVARGDANAWQKVARSWTKSATGSGKTAKKRKRR